MANDLERVSSNVIQRVYECLFQAIGEDYQEAASYLNLETHISKPFLNWDLMYRNLIHEFSGSSVLYSTKKRGMWEVLLLFDTNSRMIFSFMRDTRLKSIQRNKTGQRPKYIRALLTLNDDLQAKQKQQSVFMDEDDQNKSALITLLNELCMNFTEPVIGKIQHHALIVFSISFSQITSLKALMLDKDLDIVDDQNWLNCVRPLLSNEISKVTDVDLAPVQLFLTDKAKQRIKQKELVELKSTEKTTNHNL
jgi:hypothetical protein